MGKNVIILMDDVHLEGRPSEMQIEFATLVQNKIKRIQSEGNNPIVICAGDIGEGTQGIAWASQFKCDVIYICGNHEFWGGDFYEVPLEIKDFVTKKENEHIRFLNKESVVINGTRFIGATLWTSLGNFLPIYDKNYTIKFFSTMGDFKRTTAKSWYNDENTLNLKKFMSFHGIDPNKINEVIEGQYYNPLIEIEENNNCVDYIAEALSEKFDGETIVVTHHLPAYECWMKKMKMSIESISGDAVNDENLYLESAKGNIPSSKDILMMAFYTNDLKNLMFGENAPNYWFHGHLHQEIEQIIGKTKIISSPVGYLRQSAAMKQKEILLDGNYLHIAKYIKKDIEEYEWNANLLTPLRELEKIITKFDMCISMGIMSSLDFDDILQGFQKIHKTNIEKLEAKTKEWLQPFVYHINPNIEEQNLDLYIIKRLIGYKNIMLPEVITGAVNEHSFSPYEKYKAQNISGLEYYHFRSWAKDISKIQIQISQYKKNLLDYCDEIIKKS